MPSRSQIETSIRLASSSDQSAIAALMAKAWRDTIWHRCYFAGVTDEDYATMQYDYCGQYLHSSLVDVYIAEREGAVLGYAILSKQERVLDDTPPPTPFSKTAALPLGTNVDAVRNFRSQASDWKVTMSKERGTHYRLEHIGVGPNARKEGVASMLLDAVVEDVFAQGLSLHFETIDELLPFYDRYAKRNGYEIHQYDKTVRLVGIDVHTTAHFLELKPL